MVILRDITQNTNFYCRSDLNDTFESDSTDCFETDSIYQFGLDINDNLLSDAINNSEPDSNFNLESEINTTKRSLPNKLKFLFHKYPITNKNFIND